MGSWLNNDGLYLEYGTTKAIPTTAGDYFSLGESREIEFDINIANLTTTASIQADTTFIPSNVFIDSVTVVATTAVTAITSVSIGTMKTDRSTTISDTSLVAALVLASVDGQGETTTLTGGSTYAGTTVGTVTGADVGYITAKIAGSAGTGVIRVRVKYHGVTPITQ